VGNYVAVSDVESKIQGTEFNATSEPSSTEVEQNITLIEAEMNAAFVHLGFTVPITGTESLKVCKAVALWGAAAWTLDDIYALTNVEEDERPARWWRKYEKMMEAIINSGGDQLHDAPRAEAVRVNTAPILAGEDSQEANMRFGQLTRHRQAYRDSQLERYRGWGLSKG
jgi:hypothetical protein